MKKVKRTEEEERILRLERMRKLSLRLQKKKEKEERIARYWRDIHNRATQKKADELNKIMSQCAVSREGDRYSVRLKNGQVFKFRFFPPHLFRDDKILPVLEGVKYEE